MSLLTSSSDKQMINFPNSRKLPRVAFFALSSLPLREIIIATFRSAFSYKYTNQSYHTPLVQSINFRKNLRLFHLSNCNLFKQVHAQIRTSSLWQIAYQRELLIYHIYHIKSKWIRIANTTTANITHPNGNNIFSANQSAKLFLV